MMRLRHADEWVGLLVVIAVVIFFGVALQAGVLSRWFRATETLRVMLPEKGSAGLSSGADVEVLGTKAGEIGRVVISPNQQMYAEADIDEQARAFIRRDSVAVIRKRYGVAGAAYLDIARGKGPQLDWSFAIIQATTERDPTENIGTLVDEVRGKVFPVLDDLGRTTHGIAEMVENMKKGQGDIGRLLVDDTLVKQAESTVASVQQSIARIEPILAQLQDASRDIAELTQSANAPRTGVSAVLKRIQVILGSLQDAMGNLTRASQHLPPIARTVEGSTASLPSLLIQTQQTVRDFDQLLVQMRSSWLLGGGGGAAPVTSPTRLPPTEVRP
jgi:phospholipid/cholesterol/gamma-HCH transport system substrate-binding protein